MWIFAVILFVAAVLVSGVVGWFFVLFGAFILVTYLFPGDKPTEFDADVWVADNDERAANLKRKMKSWRAGHTYFRPVAPAKGETEGAVAQPTPFVLADFAPQSIEMGTNQSLRRHPMQPAAGK